MKPIAFIAAAALIAAALAAFIAAVALAQNYPSWGEQVMAAGKDAGCRIHDWECAVKSGPPLK